MERRSDGAGGYQTRKRLMELSGVRDDEVGVYYGEVPPVPIPNTEVKLTCAEDTWLETAWENRCSPTQIKKPGYFPGFFT